MSSDKEVKICPCQSGTCLEQLRREIYNDVKELLLDLNTPFKKKWVKSKELKEELGISHGKLQTMRNSKIITFTRFGGTILYDRNDIEAAMEKNKVFGK